MICSNSTFLPLILLHNRTVKSMWSLATSSCLALSFTLHLFIPLFFPSSSVSLYSLFTLSRTVTLVLFDSFHAAVAMAFCPTFYPHLHPFAVFRVPQSDQRKLSSKVFSLPFIAFCYFTFNLPLPAHFLYLCLISSMYC